MDIRTPTNCGQWQIIENRLEHVAFGEQKGLVLSYKTGVYYYWSQNHCPNSRKNKASRYHRTGIFWLEFRVTYKDEIKQVMAQHSNIWTIGWKIVEFVIVCCVFHKIQSFIQCSTLLPWWAICFVFRNCSFYTRMGV